MGKVWTRKPYAGTKIDFNHSLAAGLEYCVPILDATGAEIVANLKQSSASAPNSFVNTEQGLAIHGTEGGTDTGIIHVNDFGFLTATDKLTVAFIGRQINTTDSDEQLFTKERGGFGAWNFTKSRNNASNVLSLNLRDATGQELGAGISYPSSEDGIWRLFVATYDGKTSRLYFDGVEQSNTVFTAQSTVIDRDYNIGIFAARTTINEGPWDIAAAFGWGNRVLTPSEIASWESNWWQIFKPQPQFALADVPEDVRFAAVKNIPSARSIGVLGDDSRGVDSSPGTADRCIVTLFESKVAGDINRGYVHFDTASTSGANAKLLVYSDDNGLPGVLVAESLGVAIPAGESTIEFEGLKGRLQAQRNYFIGVVYSSFEADVQVDGSLSGMNTDMANGTLSYSSPPTVWPGTDINYSNLRVNAYVTVKYDSVTFVPFNEDLPDLATFEKPVTSMPLKKPNG